MLRTVLVCCGLITVPAAMAPAEAAPFACPEVGGDLVFALEANINSLDAQTTGAVSTRNVVNNIFEPLLSGELDAMQFLAPPIAMYVPKTYEPDLVAAWHDLNSLPDADARHDAYVRMQKIVLDDALAMPFGALPKMQAVRSNVKNFQTFRIPRMWNVWLAE